MKVGRLGVSVGGVVSWYGVVRIRLRAVSIGFVHRLLTILALIDGDHDVLMLDIETQTVEEAHINIRDPDEREP